MTQTAPQRCIAGSWGPVCVDRPGREVWFDSRTLFGSYWKDTFEAMVRHDIISKKIRTTNEIPIVLSLQLADGLFLTRSDAREWLNVASYCF